MPSLYCSTPAYLLNDSSSAEQHGQQLCKDLGWTWDSHSLASNPSGLGTWASISDQQEQIARAFNASAWWAARGGYGCLQALSLLPGSDVSPPLFIGYSDCTYFHAYWWQTWHSASIHAYMPAVDHGDRARLSLRQALTGHTLTYDHHTVDNVHILRGGESHGRCFAGCLTILTSLVGTPVMPDLSGSILCIEDIDERPYQIDRAMWQLYQSGTIQQLKGLIWGCYPHQNPIDYAGPSMLDIAQQWADRLKIPSVFGLPFGHHPDPLTLICGTPCTLCASTQQWHIINTGLSDPS